MENKRFTIENGKVFTKTGYYISVVLMVVCLVIVVSLIYAMLTYKFKSLTMFLFGTAYIFGVSCVMYYLTRFSRVAKYDININNGLDLLCVDCFDAVSGKTFNVTISSISFIQIKSRALKVLGDCVVISSSGVETRLTEYVFDINMTKELSMALNEFGNRLGCEIVDKFKGDTE